MIGISYVAAGAETPLLFFHFADISFHGDIHIDDALLYLFAFLHSEMDASLYLVFTGIQWVTASKCYWLLGRHLAAADYSPSISRLPFRFGWYERLAQGLTARSLPPWCLLFLHSDYLSPRRGWSLPYTPHDCSPCADFTFRCRFEAREADILRRSPPIAFAFSMHGAILIIFIWSVGGRYRPMIASPRHFFSIFDEASRGSIDEWWYYTPRFIWASRAGTRAFTHFDDIFIFLLTAQALDDLFIIIEMLVDMLSV